MVIRVIRIDQNDDDDDGDDGDDDGDEEEVYATDLFFVVLELKRVLSRPTSRESFSFFLCSFAHTHTNKQTNKVSFNKQRILCGSLCEEAPSSLDLSELHRQGHEGVLRTWPGKVFKISFFSQRREG